jgi:hypothetical protein
MDACITFKNKRNNAYKRWVMAKKKVKKAAAKRAKPHRHIEVVFRRKEFGKAPVEKHFVLHDGRKIGSLFQLVDELETMSEDAFRQYVTEWKNDFASWARDVFETPALADEIQQMRSRVDVQRAVMKHLLREIAHVASREHRSEVKQEVMHRKGKPVRCVIH